MSYNPYGPYYPPQTWQSQGAPYPTQMIPTQYPQYQYPSPLGGMQQQGYGGLQQPGYGGWQQPGFGGVQQQGYGGVQQPGYGGWQQPGYGGWQQPGYGGSTTGRNPRVPVDAEYRSRKRK
jgi:hypothetical protein